MILKTNDKTTNLNTCGINPEVGKLLVDQLSNELYNKLLYEEFSSFYSEKGLVLLAKYFHERANEEEEHYQWIKKFLEDNDYKYSHPGVADIDEKYDSLVDPFKISLEVEVETTEDIYNIYETAVENKDWIAVQWLMSDNSSYGCLIKEQAEEMSLSRTVLEIAQFDGDWLTKEQTIMRIYSSK